MPLYKLFDIFVGIVDRNRKNREIENQFIPHLSEGDFLAHKLKAKFLK